MYLKKLQVRYKGGGKGDEKHMKQKKVCKNILMILAMLVFLFSWCSIAHAEEKSVLLKDMHMEDSNECEIWEKELKDLTENNEGELNVAFPLMRSTCMVPQIMTSFFQKYPKVKVNILEETYSIQEKLLLNDQLDFGIFNEVHKHPKLEYELLKKEEILLIMPPEHPLAAAGSVSTHGIYPKLDLSLLAEEPFILHFPEQTTGQLSLEALKAAHIKPYVPMQSRNTETCVKLCMQGLGMCFTPETYVQNMDLPVKPACFSIGEDGVFSTLTIAYRRGTYLPQYARDFICTARKVL